MEEFSLVYRPAHGFGASGKRKTVIAAVLIAAMGSLYIALAPGRSSAATGGIHANGIQELDGSIDFTGNSIAYGTTTHDTAPETAAPWDWSSLFTNAGPGGSISTVGAACQAGTCPGLISAVGQPYTGDLFTKGSKDVADVSAWNCTQQATPPKDQLVNVYGTAWTAQQAAGSIQPGDTTVFLGLERPSTNGNSNAGFWLFKNTVLCNPASGTFVDQNGAPAKHSNGDVFIVGSFLGGGTNAVLTATPWQCTPTSPTNDTCKTTGGLGPSVTGSLNCPAIPASTTTDLFCEAVNQSVIGATTTNWDVHTPWSNIVTGGTGPGDIPGPGFLEMGIDLSRVLPTSGFGTSCFASFLTDTRSSGSSTQAETKNFINGRFPTCGSATIHKYIDTNLNGHYDAASDITASVVPAVSMTVSDPTGKTICVGSTDSNGSLGCPAGTLQNLTSGTYTVTETQLPGFYNTDPGTGTSCNDTADSSATPPSSADVNEAATVACTFKVANGGAAAIFLGNQCTVPLTFQVGSVPSGTTGMKVSWTVTSGFDAGKSSGSTGGDVSLSPTAAPGVYAGTSTFPFIQNDKVAWSFYINNDPTHTEPGQTSVDLSNNVFSPTTGLAACGKTTQSVFATSSIKGFKYKDLSGAGFDGSGNVPAADLAHPMGGVTFTLMSGGSVVATTVSSGADGSFTFIGVIPGTYTVQEVVPAGWTQTAPTGPSDYTVTVNLGDGVDQTSTTGKTLNFLNTPSYDFSMSFHSDANLPGTTTPATNGAITCNPNPASSTGSGTGSYTSGVQQGASQTYTCTLVVTDP